MIKVALVDDHVILRKSLAILIQMRKEYEVVLQAGNGQDLIDTIAATGILPDIVLLDITMPKMDGVETAAWLAANHPNVRILTLSMSYSEQVIIRMLKNGARGYILKDCEPAELFEALHKVYTKGYYYNKLVTPRLRAKEAGSNPTANNFSGQEIIFMRWVCTEKTYREIAVEMKVSHRTVDGYRDSLFRKLNVTTRIGIVMYAVKSKLVQI